MHFLLFYTYVPDVLERRAAVSRRAPETRPRIHGARRAGPGGAFADPVDGGVLVLLGADQETWSKHSRKTDPYVTGGLVTEWKVREWTTVVGKDAAHPLPPGL